MVGWKVGTKAAGHNIPNGKPCFLKGLDIENQENCTNGRNDVKFNSEGVPRSLWYDSNNGLVTSDMDLVCIALSIVVVLLQTGMKHEPDW